MMTRNPCRRFAAVLLLAISACSTSPATVDLERVQKRAVAGIQAAQRESTAALVAGTITVAQDQAAQQRLVAARAAVLAARTPADAVSAAQTVGVKP